MNVKPLAVARMEFIETVSTHVQRYRNANHENVEPEEWHILCETIGNQFRPNQVDEVNIQAAIDQSEDDFLNPIPYFVDMDECFTDLEPGRDPYDKDADVYHPQDGGYGPFQPSGY